MRKILQAFSNQALGMNSLILCCSHQGLSKFTDDEESSGKTEVDSRWKVAIDGALMYISLC